MLVSLEFLRVIASSLHGSQDPFKHLSYGTVDSYFITDKVSVTFFPQLKSGPHYWVSYLLSRTVTLSCPQSN